MSVLEAIVYIVAIIMGGFVAIAILMGNKK